MRKTIQAFAEHLDVASRTVAYWEAAGAGTTPRPFHQSMLDTVYARLDAATSDRFAALLAAQDDTSAASAPGAVTDLFGGQEASSSTVRSATITQLNVAAEVFTKWDHERGALAVSQAANAQIKWAKSLLELPCPDPLRRDLYGATARLGLVAGFVNFDAHCHELASQIFSFAVECAREAGDPHLEAKLLSHQARQAIYCAMADQSFPLLNRALGLRGLTATERAMLHTGRARALAKQGRATEAIAAMAKADDAFSAANAGLDPPWMAYYDEAQHLGDTGHALFDLAVEGAHEREAIRRFRAAVSGHTDAYARSRAMSMIKLASLLMATGDPHEATATAFQSLPIAGEIGSQRVTSLLRELLRYSTTHRHIDEVKMLRPQIMELVTP